MRKADFEGVAGCDGVVPLVAVKVSLHQACACRRLRCSLHAEKRCARLLMHLHLVKGQVSEGGVMVAGLNVGRQAVGWQMDLQFTGVGRLVCSSGIGGS